MRHCGFEAVDEAVDGIVPEAEGLLEEVLDGIALYVEKNGLPHEERRPVFLQAGVAEGINERLLREIGGVV